jgi:hypothetical protein
MKSFVFACIALALAPVAFAQSGPVMLLEQATIDYGTVNRGSDPFRTVRFKNAGVEPLVILHVQSSCGCLVVTAPSEPIMPGAWGEVRMRYDTQRLGQFQKSVAFVTNDTSGQPNSVTVTGTVVGGGNKPEIPDGSSLFPG